MAKNKHVYTLTHQESDMIMDCLLKRMSSPTQFDTTETREFIDLLIFKLCEQDELSCQNMDVVPADGVNAADLWKSLRRAAAKKLEA